MHSYNLIKLLIFAILFTSLAALSLTGTAFAQDEEPGGEEDPSDEIEYQVSVRAEFSGERVAGLTFDIAGDGVARTESSNNSTDVVFDGLEAGDYQISISIPSSSEFELAGTNSTQTVSLSEDSPQDTVVFPLQRKPPDVDENIESIKNFNFPSSLTKVGSSTTKLSDLSPEQLANVQNFTLDNPGINKIVYIEGLNLENFEEYSNIVNIGEYIDLETVGEVSFDTDRIQKFDQPATIYMSKLNLIEFNYFDSETDDEPIALIHRDGDPSDEITNLNYEGNTLSFNVPGFSTYTVVPRLDYELGENVVEEEDRDGYFTASADEVEMVVAIDNLDADVEITRDGEIINFDTEISDEGVLTANLALEPGDNRFAIDVDLVNGETAQEIVRISYEEEEETTNNASELFGWALIAVAVLGAAAGGGYYYYNKKRKGKKKPVKKENLASTKSGPDYDERLLTEEEKKVYADADEEDENKKTALERKQEKSGDEDKNKSEDESGKKLSERRENKP